MTNIDLINLIASVASLILSIVAIWLSLYFYNQAKKTENTVNSSLESIKSQATSLERLTARWMDRLTKYVTDSRPADETTVMLMSLIKETVTPVSTQLNAPASTQNEELISSYIAIYYYAAITNIEGQALLPSDIADLETDGATIKGIVDSSNNDFLHLKGVLSGINERKLKASPLYHLFLEAVDMKPHVRDTANSYSAKYSEEA